MASISEINATAISAYGGVGFAPNVSPAPESKGFINFGLANQTKPIKEIVYNFLGFDVPSEIIDKLPDVTPNIGSESNARQTLQSIQSRINTELEKLKNTMPIMVDIPKLNDTAASPNALSLGIPGIIVIAGIIGLFILGRKN